MVIYIVCPAVIKSHSELPKQVCHTFSDSKTYLSVDSGVQECHSSTKSLEFDSATPKFSEKKRAELGKWCKSQVQDIPSVQRRRCSLLSRFFLPADRLRKTCVRWFARSSARAVDARARSFAHARNSIASKSERVRQISTGSDAGTAVVS